jgi:hypothetical protein
VRQSRLADILLVTIEHLSVRGPGCYGNPVAPTPQLDRLAAEGVQCTRSFCTSPGCSPSRAALATGRYPHCNGVMGLAHAHFGWELALGERHIAELDLVGAAQLCSRFPFDLLESFPTRHHRVGTPNHRRESALTHLGQAVCRVAHQNERLPVLELHVNRLVARRMSRSWDDAKRLQRLRPCGKPTDPAAAWSRDLDPVAVCPKCLPVRALVLSLST